MRYEFCTLFDMHYLSRGLVLYESLRETCPEFRLRVFAMDSDTQAALGRLELPEVEIISLDELEASHPELLVAKTTRSRTEYYWTTTPTVLLHSLERDPGLEMITYLDADTMFFADPGILFDELGEGNALITPHHYAPEYYSDSVSQATSADTGGTFNVQFVSVRRTEPGLAALRWWHDRCIEWCYDRVEPGRFGDQKYLDEWPRRFAGVVSNEHPGGGLAPWNVSQYRIEHNGQQLLVDGQPLVFHHYQSLHLHESTKPARALSFLSAAYRFTDGGMPLVWTTGWRLSKRELSVLWDDYVRRLGAAATRLQRAGVAGGAGTRPLRPRDVAFHIIRRHLPKPVRRLYWRVRRQPGYTA